MPDIDITVSMTQETYAKHLKKEFTKGYNVGYGAGTDSCNLLVMLVENVNAPIPIHLEHLTSFIQTQRDLKLSFGISFSVDSTAL